MQGGPAVLTRRSASHLASGRARFRRGGMPLVDRPPIPPNDTHPAGRASTRPAVASRRAAANPSASASGNWTRRLTAAP